jgi:hypothetical protein
VPDEGADGDAEQGDSIQADPRRSPPAGLPGRRVRRAACGGWPARIGWPARNAAKLAGSPVATVTTVTTTALTASKGTGAAALLPTAIHPEQRTAAKADPGQAYDGQPRTTLPIPHRTSTAGPPRPGGQNGPADAEGRADDGAVQPLAPRRPTAAPIAAARRPRHRVPQRSAIKEGQRGDDQPPGTREAGRCYDDQGQHPAREMTVMGLTRALTMGHLDYAE